MNLTTWIGVLRSAAHIDPTILDAGAQRIVTRASMLAMGDSSFFVVRTPAGVKITANNPTPRARRALNQATKEELPKIREAVAAAARERLQE